MTKNKLPISVLILTFNEERNIEEALRSIIDSVKTIYIIDSYSSDDTLEIAKKYTDRIYQHEFENQARQLAWALKSLPIDTEWIMRLDADERWTEKGLEELKKIINSNNADGIYVKMMIFFMNKWIKYGDFYPNYFLRVFKKSRSVVEDRWMDEHIIIQGKTIMSNIDVIEANYDRQKDISLWIDKHNKYASREALECIINKYKLRKMDTIANLLGNKTERKRWAKENIYYKLPLFIRPFMYFIYRYFLKLGFLDGKEGLIFHFLHAFWYRFLVDIKVYQLIKLSENDNKPISEVISEIYKIDP